MSSDDVTSSTPDAGNFSSERLMGRVKWFNNRAGTRRGGCAHAQTLAGGMVE